MRRRTALALPALAALPARAQSQVQPPWPERPLRLIVPYPPAGAVDLLGRAWADLAGPSLGQTVVVENLPGGGTTVGASAARRAAPDGYTLLLATSTTLAIAPALHERLAYDPVADFAMVGLLARAAFALIVPKEGPRDLAAFLAAAKEGGSPVAFGSAGPGSPQHIAFELLRTRAGFAAEHVPYRGTSQAVLDLMAGRLRAMFCDLAPAMPHLQSGAVRALAVTTAERLRELPAVPTLAESGLEGFDVAWQALVAPAGVPEPVLRRLSSVTVQIMDSEAGRTRLDAAGLIPDPRPREVLPGFVAAEVARWGPIVRASGARAG